MSTKTIETLESPSTSISTTTERRTGFGFSRESMTPVHWATAGLAAITGVVHLYLFATTAFEPFLFAGAVFMAAILGMLVIPYGHIARKALYALGVPFTMGQIVAWYVIDGQFTALAVGDKLVQVALILALIYLFRMELRR